MWWRLNVESAWRYMVSTIVQAYEDSRKCVKACTLRALGTSVVTGRKVLAWSSHQGTYGMGGPGFFQLTLASRDRQKTENLVLCLWGACEWLLLNGRWMEAHPRYYEIQRPLFSNFFGEEWDLVTRHLSDVDLDTFDLQEQRCCLSFTNGLVLELPDDKSLLPLNGDGSTREFASDDSLWDAWVLTEESVLWI